MAHERYHNSRTLPAPTAIFGLASTPHNNEETIGFPVSGSLPVRALKIIKNKNVAKMKVRPKARTVKFPPKFGSSVLFAIWLRDSGGSVVFDRNVNSTLDL